MFKLSKTSFTTILKEHLESCKKHSRIENGQKGNQLAQILEDESIVTLTNFKYEKNKEGACQDDYF